MGFKQNIRKMLNAYFETERQYFELIRIIPIENERTTEL